MGIYCTSDLRCLYLILQRWPARCIAFHPELPLVAVGSGSYDCSWAYTGELVVIDLTTGRSTSVVVIGS